MEISVKPLVRPNESVEVEMEDGRTLHLYDALLTMIESRVTGFIILTERLRTAQSGGDGRQGEEWLH